MRPTRNHARLTTEPTAPTALRQAGGAGPYCLRCIAAAALLCLGMALAPGPVCRAADPATPPPAFSFPRLDKSHVHMRRVVENCLAYIRPRHGLIDAASGYPVEGWNHDPEQGVFLRSFTQLTAIGAWIELLANIAAGYAANPYLSAGDALRKLERAVASLRCDQQNPELSAGGLLVNFLAFEGGRRRGPLEETVDRQAFFDAFGRTKGSALWQALQQKGWLRPEKKGLVGRVLRGGTYGVRGFTGPLAPFAGENTKAAVMRILDARAVLVMFGDNANLTASLARAIGALRHPGISQGPMAARLAAEMELFIEAQKDGYRHFYDAGSATLAFGRDAARDRFVGWDDGAGNWVTGRMDYLISEFRGPWIFAALRFDLPRGALAGAGLKVKPYRTGGAGERYGLCAWDGAAFQLFGFSVFMDELQHASWRACLERLVDIELDYSRRFGLPGLLSEAYSGRGTEYTRYIGIPDIAVTDHALIGHAPSLYSLGAAYQIAPDRVESFVAENWSAISSLFTDHGPWEGYDVRKKAPIPFQTTTHTLSLVLAAIGSAGENMRRYLTWKGQTGALRQVYAAGRDCDFFSPVFMPAAWTSDGSPISVSRDGSFLRFTARFRGQGGLAWQAPLDRPLSLSGGMLRLRYRSAGDAPGARIELKGMHPDTKRPESLPVELFIDIKKTGGRESSVDICLPAAPVLQEVVEVSLVLGVPGQATAADLTLTGFEFTVLR